MERTKGEMSMAGYKIDIEKSAQNILNKIYERFGVSAERLVELAFADRAGRCVVLPCKVGDTVYTNVAIRGDRYRKADRPYPVKVVFIGMGEHSAYFNVAYDNGRCFPFDFDQIGKDVFLTLESAEAMLEKEACEG